LDYAKCHVFKGNRKYRAFIDIFRRSRQKGLPLTESDILGLFNGTPNEVRLSTVKSFLYGDFDPTRAEDVRDFIEKSKLDAGGLRDSVVKELRARPTIGKGEGGETVTVPAAYFYELITAFNTTVNAALREQGSKELRETASSALLVMERGGLYRGRE
jgi:hypothetical protein